MCTMQAGLADADDDADVDADAAQHPKQDELQLRVRLEEDAAQVATVINLRQQASQK